jgi:hypothetical protein
MDREELLDELARVYAIAAVDKFIAEKLQDSEKATPRKLELPRRLDQPSRITGTWQEYTDRHFRRKHPEA